MIPISKPRKPSDIPENYRPISLTCNLCKILEKIISRRIRWYLETKKLLSSFQFGFRQFRSTSDYLAILEGQACDAIANGSHLITVTLDLEKAYERAWKARILLKLQEINIKGNMLAFIANFLMKIFIRVRMNTTRFLTKLK